LHNRLNNASFVASPGIAQPPPGGVVASVGRPPFRLGANQLNPVLNPWNGLVLEIVGTSLLVGTVLTTAVDERALSGVNSLAPLPIGFSVMVAHLCLIPWTGCGINPARTFGPALINSLAGVDTWQGSWWIYYVGPGIGSVVTSFAVWFLWGGVR
jgi:glycerol uptake facilitator-like aquaporin